MIPAIQYSGKCKTIATVKRSVVAGGCGWGEEMDKYVEQREFPGQWKYSVWYCNNGRMPFIYICPNVYYVQQQGWNVMTQNYGLWVILVCQQGFYNCSKYTTFVGEVDNVGGYACARVGAIWKTSIPPPQFCCEPKSLLYKIKSWNK